MRYAVDIDQVVLDGFASIDRKRIAAGISEELSRLLSTDGLARKLGNVDRVDGGTIDVVPGDDRATGRNLARGVHRGLAR